MILVILLHALGASTFVLAKKGLAVFSPFPFVALRMIGAGLGFLFYSFLKKEKYPKNVYSLFILAGFVHICIPFACEFWALQYLTSIKTNLLFSATPFISAFFSYLFKNELLTVRQWCGLLCGTTSMLLLQINEGLSSFFLGIPEMILLAGIASSVCGWLLVQHLLDRGISLPAINGWAMSIGGVLCAVLSLISGSSIIKANATHLFEGIFYLLLLTFVSNVGLYTLYSWLLQRYSLTFISCAGFLSPFFGFFLGYFFCGERILPSYLLSFGAIIVGLYLFYLDEKA